ncbi:hypothetical protein, partial [Stenotrophomonas maltophilia]|uniref:hypothetical protein n=1 Tax=Stenotrophomonas maltophilia TaxID=40324 RepID=UPI0025546047
PATPTHPAADSSRARQATEENKEQQKRVARCACSRSEHGWSLQEATNQPANPFLLLIFSFLFRG